MTLSVMTVECALAIYLFIYFLTHLNFPRYYCSLVSRSVARISTSRFPALAARQGYTGSPSETQYGR